MRADTRIYLHPWPAAYLMFLIAKHLIRRSGLFSRPVSETLIGDEDLREGEDWDSANRSIVRYVTIDQIAIPISGTGFGSPTSSLLFLHGPFGSLPSLVRPRFALILAGIHRSARSRVESRVHRVGPARSVRARGLFIASFAAEGLVKGRGYIYLVASGCGTLEIHPLPCLRGRRLRPNGGRIFMRTLNERRMYL